jgi:hypothetical protein
MEGQTELEYVVEFVNNKPGKNRLEVVLGVMDSYKEKTGKEPMLVPISLAIDEAVKGGVIIEKESGILGAYYPAKKSQLH